MLTINFAIFLAHCCKLSYDQFNDKGSFNVPKGFQLIDTFKGDSFDKTEWFGYIMESNDSIIITFRGTVTDQDWLEDVEVYQTAFPYVSNSGSVHHGFLHIYSSFRNKIMNILKERAGNKVVYITGHSLGAALAVLHALDAASNLNFKEVVMVNFGGPRVGDPRFASIYNNNLVHSYRIVNIFDRVPKLPMKKVHWFFGKVYHYKHVREPIFIAEQKGTNHLNHALDTYIKGLKKLSI